MLSELEAMSARVDGARDQAVILMTGRGPACRDVVEPKLEDLNRNFLKVAQHIRTAQVTRAHLGFRYIVETHKNVELKPVIVTQRDKIETAICSVGGARCNTMNSRNDETTDESVAQLQSDQSRQGEMNGNFLLILGLEWQTLDTNGRKKKTGVSVAMVTISVYGSVSPVIYFLSCRIFYAVLCGSGA